VILEHENTVRSYYYHLRSTSIASDRASFEKNEVLGVSGNTGRSLGAHLHLSITDSSGYQNPLSLLPAYPDRVAPEVASIMFGLDGRVITVPKKYRVSGIDSFTLLARVWDSQEDIRNINTLGPYKVTFSIDGEAVRAIIFDRLAEKDGRLTLTDGTGYADTWSEEGYLIGGDFRGLVGQHEFTVTAEDFAGNTTSYSVEANRR
jgi:hypothetical protein